MIVVIWVEPTGRITRCSSQQASFYRDRDRVGNRNMPARLGDHHRRDTYIALALGFLLQNGGDQRLATNRSATTPGFIAGPLHRVVLGEPSIRSGHPLPEAVMLPGR